MKKFKKYGLLITCCILVAMLVTVIFGTGCNNKSKTPESSVPTSDTLKKTPEVKDSERLEPMSTRPVKTPN